MLVLIAVNGNSLNALKNLESHLAEKNKVWLSVLE